MNYSRLQAAAVWAISAWPGLNFISANWEQVAAQGPGAVFGIVISTLLIGTVGHALHWLAERSQRGGFFVVIWLELICLFFGYAGLRDASRWVFEALALQIPPFAGFIAAMVLVLGGTLLLRNSAKLQLAALTFSFAAATISLAVLAFAALRFDSHSNSQSQELPVAQTPAGGLPHQSRGPNVYYIILDSYPGLRGLRVSAGIDNSAFMARMAARGFVDRSTERSNYLATSLELGAIFAMDYALTDDPRTYENPRLQYPRLLEGNSPPPMVARFKAAGYAAWYSPSVWNECPRRHFNCLGNLAFMSVDQMTQAYFAPTPFGRPLLYVLGRRQDALASITRELDTLAKSTRPIFVFGHHSSPHPPFLFDRNCKPYEVRNESWDNWNPGVNAVFLDAITCVNLQVEKLVDAILRVDPDPVIVFQGDHGSAFAMKWAESMATWSSASIAERASYLNLIRAPGYCARWLDRPLGQVNTARFVVACAERRQPDFLPEQTFLSTYTKGPERNVVRKWNE